MRTLQLLCLAVMFPVLAACEPYRVEYHRRPSFMHQVADNELPDEVVMRDGTRIVYGSPPGGRSRAPSKPKSDEESGGASELREERSDGEITLRGFMPEHLLAHLITCLNNREYDLIYDQLLSEPTRREWEREGRDKDDFANYLERNRRELVRSLTRIYMGINHHDTRIEHLGEGVTDVVLGRRAAEGLKFRRVRMLSEGYSIKLVMIR
ncbi:MAG: hypothetical protein EA377_13945 [Phycisphaerales bacterium]|nr:MAG: hypothetical protein EA377_13945 [Phycisphaerales bacterium]